MANGRELKPITEGKRLDELAEAEDMKQALVKQCFMIGPDGNVFIRRAGLLFKTEKKFKGVGYSVLTEVPSEEEIKRLRAMLGLKEGMPAAIMKGIVRTREGDEWSDYGTATPENTNKMTAVYLLEMACTRATNRAMRIATVCGFTSVEELPPSGQRSPLHPGVTPTDTTEAGDAHSEDDEEEKPHDQDDDLAKAPDKRTDEVVQPPVSTARLNEKDDQAMREHLFLELGVAPWHVMNYLKKHYGLGSLGEVTYPILADLMTKADSGYFSKPTN